MCLAVSVYAYLYACVYVDVCTYFGIYLPALVVGGRSLQVTKQ